MSGANASTGAKESIGVISSVTQPFCGDCTRARLSADGRLFTCLFASTGVDLRTPMRQSESDAPLEAAIREAIDRKPKGHDFIIDRRHTGPAVPRHMSVTGG